MTIGKQSWNLEKSIPDRGTALQAETWRGESELGGVEQRKDVGDEEVRSKPWSGA